MKKIVATIAFICYFAVTCGVIVNFHYCMNRLDSVRFYLAETDYCGKCGKHIDKSRGCCRDEVKIVKMEVDQKVSSSVVFELPAPEIPVCIPSQFITAPVFNIETARHFHNHSPPLLTEQDTYLQNRVFRI